MKRISNSLTPPVCDRPFHERARRLGSTPRLCWALGLGAVPLSFGSAGCGEELAAPRTESYTDLARVEPQQMARLLGSTGNGATGVPVAGGLDVDGDGFADAAMAAMRASPGDRSRSGTIYLWWGDGQLSGVEDTARPSARVLAIHGSQPNENAGSELWMDDVNGDGFGDLLIARQNHSWDDNGELVEGAGALSIVWGSSALRQLSDQLEPLELSSPPPGIEVLTLLGPQPFDRLGIWMRTGDVTGDGIADVLVGADQDDTVAETAGAVYLLAGGPELATTQSVHLGDTAGSAIEGRVLQLLPPSEPTPTRFHVGATCQIGDLDGDGRGEVMAAAALARIGASLDSSGGFGARSSGGSARGTLYVVWGDSLPSLPWATDQQLAMTETDGFTTLGGMQGNFTFGEELLGGFDWDADDKPDLFVGDLTAAFRARPDAGSSHVIYDAGRLRGLDTTLDQLSLLEPPIFVSHFLGAQPNDISGDTAAAGDFNGDGIDDLITCSPHASPFDRVNAGTIHVLLGGTGRWPEVTDLAAPDSSLLPLAEVYGARGATFGDAGDTLCYSAAVGDLDADGQTDLIVNEMVGNGTGSQAVDVGNTLLLRSDVLTGNVDPEG